MDTDPEEEDDGFEKQPGEGVAIARVIDYHQHGRHASTPTMVRVEGSSTLTMGHPLSAPLDIEHL